jgi:hypothetical protein
MNRTNYLVEQMAADRKWRTVYDDSALDGMPEGLSRLYAFDIAADLVNREPRNVVRITETKLRNGRLASLTEYGVNPPHWSGEPMIAPRGAEIYIREHKEFQKPDEEAQPQPVAA